MHPTPQAQVAARQAERAVAAGFTWPDGWTVSDLGICTAASCRRQILWCVTPAGKRAPVDADGKSHFASCIAAAQFRRPR